MHATLAILTLQLALTANPATTPALPPQLELHPLEHSLIERTNAERTRYGLPALAIDATLVRSARQHAAWMTANQVLQHTSAMVAENIAAGQPTVGRVVQDWMNSSGHRANILNPRYRRIGVAAYRTTNGTVYWCQQFLN
jgi:uncharacterized protein YkwD